MSGDGTAGSQRQPARDATFLNNPEVFVSHANATLTPRGRLLLARCVVIDR
jgi:hypothetical protein